MLLIIICVAQHLFCGPIRSITILRQYTVTTYRNPDPNGLTQIAFQASAVPTPNHARVTLLHVTIT